MSRPTSTYRVQLTPDFGFAQVAEIAGYLRDLGVSHVYLSPILQATPESRHGYDVTDHSRIREEFGWATGFREMAQQLAAQDLGIVVDIVPNHMNTVNAQFWSVLKNGPDSPYAKWFDIDWQDGKVALPVLGDDTEPVVDGDVLRYHEHAFPHPGHYRLVDWREGPGYRRFFDVSSLIGLRVEDPSVFFATHEVIFWLLDEGLVDGLRIDHPDGLADPRGYLQRLRERTGGAWTVVEKILIDAERLPADWPCDGTSGYEVLNRVNGLFVDPAGKEPLIRLFTDMTGQPATYRPVMAQAKQDVLDLFFGAEVDRLAKATSCDPAAVRELLAAMPVYRAYVVPGEPPPPESVEIVELAAEACSPAVQPLVRQVLYGSAESIVRFQQSCGPVMAKGVEDTALYRWFPLACLNEVGGEPDAFGMSVEDFHAFCGEMSPYTMTTLSTHDTKRSEDVRARLSVLSELPGEWAAQVEEWSAQVSFDPHLDYLAWQNLMAAWPISAERFTDYLLKAAREAKTAISWVNPDPSYERRLRAFAEAAVRLPIGGFVERIDPYAMSNSLGAKLVQLMMPGVPDVYQGNETTDFSLVDPDNRRPVTYPRKPETAWDSAKLLVTSQALRLRRRLGGAAPYMPLWAEGERAEHVIAFARGSAEDGARPRTAGAGGARSRPLADPGTGDRVNADLGPFGATDRGATAHLGAGSSTGSGAGSDALSGPGSPPGSGAGSDALFDPGSPPGSGSGWDALSGRGSPSGSGTGSDAPSGPSSPPDSGAGSGDEAGDGSPSGSGARSGAGWGADSGGGSGALTGVESPPGPRADGEPGDGSRPGTGVVPHEDAGAGDGSHAAGVGPHGEAGSGPHAEAGSDVGPSSEPGTGSRAGTGAGTETGASPHAGTGAGVRVGTGGEVGPRAGAGAGSDSVVGAEGPESEAGDGVGPYAGTGAGARVGTGGRVGPHVGVGAGPFSEAEGDMGPYAEAGTGAGTGTGAGAGAGAGAGDEVGVGTESGGGGVGEVGVRARAVVVATRLPVRLAATGWGATTLTLPPGTWRDLLTGGLYTGRIPLGHLLGQYPVSLLERHDL